MKRRVRVLAWGFGIGFLMGFWEFEWPAEVAGGQVLLRHTWAAVLRRCLSWARNEARVERVLGTVYV